MSSLRERDTRLALEFAYDAASMTGPDPFPLEILDRLAQLIPADAIVGYRDERVDDFPYRVVELVEIPKDPIPPHMQEAASRCAPRIPCGTERDPGNAAR